MDPRDDLAQLLADEEQRRAIPAQAPLAAPPPGDLANLLGRPTTPQDLAWTGAQPAVPPRPPVKPGLEGLLGRPTTFEDVVATGGDVSGSPRLSPTRTPEQNFGRAIGSLADQAPPLRQRIGGALQSADVALGSAVHSITPPELRGKVSAINELANPQKWVERGTEALQKGDVLGATSEAFNFVPGAGQAAVAAKMAPAMFLGAGAVGAPKKAFTLARKMEREGATPAQIFDATADLPAGRSGLEKLADKKYRYEISDEASSINQDVLSKAPVIGESGSDVGFPMHTVFNHPELYKAYPHMRDIEVKRTPDLMGIRGGYDPEKNQIFLNKNLSPKEARDVILHELQHSVQDFEKFAQGGSQYMPAVITRGKKIEKEVFQTSKQRLDELLAQRTSYINEKSISIPTGKQEQALMEKWAKDNPDLAKDLKTTVQYINNIPQAARYEAYRRMIGETEARTTAASADLPIEARFLARPETRGDIPREKQWSHREAFNEPTYPQQNLRMEQVRPQPGEINPERNVKFIKGRPQLVEGDFHKYSAVRSGKPIGEAMGEIANIQNISPPIKKPDEVFKPGQYVIFAPGDRTRTGGELTSVGGTQLRTPQKMEGGPGYPKGQSIWANADPAANRFVNLATGIKEMSGKNPLLSYVALGPRSMDSSRQAANVAVDLAQQAEISRKGRSSINEFMRRPKQEREAETNYPGKDFPGWDTKAFPEWFANASGAERSKLVKALDRKEIMKYGGPDIGESRIVQTDPRLYNTPTGSTGLTISEFNPSLGTKPSGHSTYETDLLGGKTVSLGGSVPFHLASPDITDVLKKAGEPVRFANRPDYYLLQGLPGALPPVQKMTPKIIDRLSEWYEQQMGRHGKLWSMGAPAGLGALAAQDQYRREQ